MSEIDVFPDPTSRWKPYSSPIDGIGLPFVFPCGLSHGALRLMVLESAPGTRAYGIEVACEMHLGIEEMIYSTSGHGDAALTYNGEVYVKEAESSQLLTALPHENWSNRTWRHFAFVGADYCFETLGFTDPVVFAFSSEQEARLWAERGR